jgi:Spy/CpxP family protein refolding chaperone
MASAQPRLAEMRALAEALHALLDSGSTDAQAVGEKAIALHRLRGELRAERQAAEAEFVKLLSAEQRFAFEALEESRPLRRDRRGGRHGPGWGLGAPEPELD